MFELYNPKKALHNESVARDMFKDLSDEISTELYIVEPTVLVVRRAWYDAKRALVQGSSLYRRCELLEVVLSTLESYFDIESSDHRGQQVIGTALTELRELYHLACNITLMVYYRGSKATPEISDL